MGFVGVGCSVELMWGLRFSSRLGEMVACKVLIIRLERHLVFHVPHSLCLHPSIHRIKCSRLARSRADLFCSRPDVVPKPKC